MRPNIAVSRLAGSPNLIFRERSPGGMRQMNDWSRLAVDPIPMAKTRTETPDCTNKNTLAVERKGRRPVAKRQLFKPCRKGGHRTTPFVLDNYLS